MVSREQLLWLLRRALSCLPLGAQHSPDELLAQSLKSCQIKCDAHLVNYSYYYSEKGGLASVRHSLMSMSSLIDDPHRDGKDEASLACGDISYVTHQLVSRHLLVICKNAHLRQRRTGFTFQTWKFRPSYCSLCLQEAES